MKPMSPASVAAFRAAVTDPRAIERYEAKVHRTGDCDWWTGAVSGNGHGRFWGASDLSGVSDGWGWGGRGPCLGLPLALSVSVFYWRVGVRSSLGVGVCDATDCHGVLRRRFGAWFR